MIRHLLRQVVLNHARGDVRMGENLVDSVFTIEEGSSFLETAALGLDNVDVDEDRLDSQPTYVYNL